jgi:hypothetical protein
MKNIKSIILLSFTVLFISITYSCKENRNDLEKILTVTDNQIAKSCPIQLDEKTKLNSVVSIGNRTILYKLELDYYPSKQEIEIQAA